MFYTNGIFTNFHFSKGGPGTMVGMIQELIAELNYKKVLENEFQYRKDKNPLYSLRSFARDLDISPSRLSEVFNDKNDLSPQKIMEIGTKIGVPKDEVLALQAALVWKTANSEEARASAETYILNYHYQGKYQLIDETTYKILADWYHFAVLCAMELHNYDGTPEYLAHALHLDVKTVTDALRRMLIKNLIKLENSKFLPTGEMFTTTQDVESKAIQEAHAQVLDMAKASLTEVAVELRDITSITVAIDLARLPEAKKMIRDFRRSMARFLEGGKKEAVYSLNVQLHPMKGKADEKLH